jgi:hypothetical protein
MTFFVQAIDVRVTSQIWELAAAAEVGVLSMTPVRNSLEQIFMNAVREDSHANP